MNPGISVKNLFQFLFTCQQSTFASTDFLLLSKMTRKIENRSRKLISCERNPWRVTTSFFKTGGWNSAPAATINETGFLFYSHCHAAAALVVAICTAAIGVGKGHWTLKFLLPLVEKCFCLSFGVRKIKFHYCCRPGKTVLATLWNNPYWPHLKNPSDDHVCSHEPGCVMPFGPDCKLAFDLSSFAN